jgi:hypothetical protein
VFSRQARRAVVEEMLSLGAEAFVRKSFATCDLRDRISAVLRLDEPVGAAELDDLPPLRLAAPFQVPACPPPPGLARGRCKCRASCGGRGTRSRVARRLGHAHRGRRLHSRSAERMQTMMDDLLVLARTTS